MNNFVGLSVLCGTLTFLFDHYGDSAITDNVCKIRKPTFIAVFCVLFSYTNLFSNVLVRHNVSQGKAAVDIGSIHYAIV